MKIQSQHLLFHPMTDLHLVGLQEESMHQNRKRFRKATAYTGQDLRKRKLGLIS